MDENSLIPAFLGYKPVKTELISGLKPEKRGDIRASRVLSMHLKNLKLL